MEHLNKIPIQEVARRQIETTKQVYLLSPARMFSEYNGEKENVKNYNGRQLLEMLQNAEDAASEAKGEKKVLIKLQENQLIIANTGYPFSDEGLTSIFHSHLSPKEAIENQIGNKGLGFRSILSWANKVTIKSHDLCVAFSKEYSKNVLDELLKDLDFASSYTKLKKQTKEAPISTLVCPEVIAVDTNKYAAYSEFDTIIQIDLKETALKEVTHQIEKDIDGEVLIFLNHLESIELNINGIIKEYNKEKAPDSRVKLTTIENGVTQPERFWNINTLSDHFEDIDRNYQLSIAWKDELDEKKDVIYSYFRTKVPFHFSGILHGTFELNADRNDIISDEEGYNQKIIGLIPGLIANTAEKIANKEKKVNYKALSFTIFENNILPNIIQDSDFANKLKGALQAKKIFPTICNKYISIEDKPVYYKQDVFAKLLPKDDFPDILICSEDETIKNYLSQFETTTYLFQSLCNAISAKPKNYSMEQYASLVAALIDVVDLDKEEDKSKLCLFFDSEFNPLPFNNPIFLPSNEYKLPSEIGIQIVHPELTEELKTKLNANSYELLKDKLSKFKIKTFDFNAIVGLLISHYYSEKMKIEDIKKLNETIYGLYQNEKSLSINWQGLAVPLITKNKKIEPANNLYFGKEYGCSITEAIYNFNKNKLVNSPKEYGIDDSGSVNWKSYLKWLGVAELPRKIQVDGIEEFAEYAMRNYDFRNQIDDYRFKNFDDFKNNLNGYSEIKVTSIDDFDLILKNNTSEIILSWLNLDIELLRQVEDNKEIISSKICFNFYKAKSIRTLLGNKFKNFLKWKLSNTAWLNTKCGIKKSPRLCTTSATITDEFSPIIEKPNIDFDATIFKSNNIRPDKVDYLLNVVGVNKTISTFATKTLYSILSKLPEIDPEGKKAKPLYRELATNYEEKNLETSDAEYKKFLSEGMVFCKKKGEYSYEKANTVFYVDNKRYGESVINQFFTLEVDRRRGKTKIKKMFGVKPLEDLKLNLINQPIFHALNGKFGQEIEAFKPYVYVFRQDLDNTGKEKNHIKDVKFKLVTALSVLLELENEKLEFDLSYYEYFNLSKNNTVFIKTPQYLDDEKKLKEDVNFCSTIAEVFSALIDVDAQRQQIRELFSKSATNRDDIIRAELDDENLEKLIMAKEKLGITNNPKIQFWSAFVKCFPSKKIRHENITDEILLEELKRHFPEASEQIAVVIDSINYDNYNEEQSLRLIIELLKRTGLSIESFNKYAYPSIDISEIYELDFKRIKEEKKIEFKQAFYSSFVNSGKNKQDFLKGISQYDKIKGNFKNVINYDVEEDLSLRVQELFQLDILNVKHDFNFEEIHSANKTKFESRAEQEQISKEIANQFLNENPVFESLLYFEEELETLMISLKEWAPKSNDGSLLSGNGLAKRRLSIGDSPLFYNNYSDLFFQLENDFGNGEGRFKLNLSKINIKRTETNNPPSKGKDNSSDKNFKKPKKPNEDLGFLGEYLVYKHLYETVKNKESIKWVSEYAKLAGVNLDGNDGKGYDIEYIPNDAKYLRYVEVKVVGGENAFHITSNEIKHGEKLKRHYEIFLVRNITDPKNISIEIIQGPFDYKGQKSFNDNELFTVINDSFILKFEKTDEK